MGVEDIYHFETTTLEGEPLDLADYRGRVLLIVNTASQCGFTEQYAGLESLYRDYRDRGLVVIGFPCNQFGRQEPGNASQIRSFCETRYGVTFPLSRKIDVNGSAAHPLFRHLTRSRPGLLGTQSIKWNFTKFLVDRNGRVAGRFPPTTPPQELAGQIERLLRSE
jgi:glutathione peroxidase-family protein